ncbi:hypothetical protein [Halovivax gelatinilyticus]|uniref:hypothetical protein n=1 Tax=Halovivax gelatinilyticus TaxID=2961597 RepID=UPI0020CA3544|nr:hypothetical protein [Halovivax gelatinilyticus]
MSSDESSRLAYGRQAKHPGEFGATETDLSMFDPSLVLGYYRRLEAILDACPLDIYAASSLKHPWPYRLQNAAECYPASFWRSQHRILDSAIVHPELTNADILEHAVEREATAVVAKDYLPFESYDDRRLTDEQQRSLETLRSKFDDHREATTASIREFIELHDSEGHPPAYFPLQPPYDEHVRTVWDDVEASHLDHRYMLGGLKDATPERRIDELLAFRAEVGSEPISHGLGWGLSDELVIALRDEPDLLDSVDNSGPAQAIQNNKVLDKHWRTNPCAQVNGKYQNSIGGAFEFAMLLSGAQRLTEFNDDFDSATQQSALGEFGGVLADD